MKIVEKVSIKSHKHGLQAVKDKSLILNICQAEEILVDDDEGSSDKEVQKNDLSLKRDRRNSILCQNIIRRVEEIHRKNVIGFYIDVANILTVRIV